MYFGWFGIRALGAPEYFRNPIEQIRPSPPCKSEAGVIEGEVNQRISLLGLQEPQQRFIDLSVWITQRLFHRNERLNRLPAFIEAELRSVHHTNQRRDPFRFVRQRIRLLQEAKGRDRQRVALLFGK